MTDQLRFTMKLIGLFLLFVSLSSGTLTPIKSQVGTGVIGGRDARPNEFPYIVSLRLDNDNMEHICGGSIITKGHVLSAAHCFTKHHISIMRVVAGEHSLSQSDGTEQYSKISSFIMHDFYSDSSYFYDIALVKLSVDFILNDCVQTISLPQRYYQLFTGTAIISGWGEMDGQNSQLENPDILQTAEITLLSNERCNFPSDHPMICAGDFNPNKGGCYGDSGGPLVQNNTLIGITSSASAKDCHGLTYFTEVSSYLYWIENNM